MHRLALYIAVALVCFATGTIASWGWNQLNELGPGITQPATSIELVLTPPDPPIVKPSQRVYYVGGISGLSHERGSFTTITSSDGMEFTKWSLYFPSPYSKAKNANEALERRLRKAVGIIDREVTLSEDGKQIGEKVVALFGPHGASLLWTANNEMFEVEGASVRDIMEYRKDFKR